MDIEEVKEEVVSTFTERLRNPFIFTFIISWLAWNWLLIYEVFSFSSSYDLGYKTKIINEYIQLHICNNLTLKPLGSSFVVSLVYLLFSFLFTFLFNFYNTTVKAKIFGWTAKGKNIPKDVYDALYRRHNRLKSDFDKAKKLWNDIEKSNEALSREISKVKGERTQYRTDLELTKAEMLEVKQESKKTQDKYDEMQIFFKREREEFIRVFVNKKTWIVYSQSGKADYSKTEKLKFEENYLIRDAKSGEVKYEMKELRFSREDRIIYFKLFDFHNAEGFKIIYLFDVGYGVYRGLEKDQHGNPAKNLIYTQDEKALENFKM